MAWRTISSFPDKPVYLFFKNTMGGKDCITPDTWYAYKWVENNATHPANELQLTHWWDGDSVPEYSPC